MLRASVSLTLIVSVALTYSQVADPNTVLNPAQNSAAYKQRYPVVRPRTSIGGLDISWLTLLLFQENQRIADLLDEVKQVNQNAIKKLEQDTNVLKAKFDHLPKTTRCYLGMKFGDIPDSAITASSSINEPHAPQRARLDSVMTGSGFRGGWAAQVPADNDWIEVDLQSNVSVAGIILQGRSDIDEWVKTYKVQCDSVTVQEYSVDKIFFGNSDRNTKVVGKFPEPLTCRYVRILPQSWEVHATLRFELIRGSCFDEY